MAALQGPLSFGNSHTLSAESIEFRLIIGLSAFAFADFCSVVIDIILSSSSSSPRFEADVGFHGLPLTSRLANSKKG